MDDALPGTLTGGAPAGAQDDATPAGTPRSGHRGSLDDVVGGAPAGEVTDSGGSGEALPQNLRKKDPSSPKKAKKGPKTPVGGDGFFGVGKNGKIIVPEEESEEKKRKKEERAIASARAKEDLELKKAEKARLQAEEKERLKVEIEAGRAKTDLQVKVSALSLCARMCGCV